MKESLSKGFAKIAGPLSWAMSLFVALQCAVLAIAMVRVVPIFGDMLRAMQVELPWPTRILLSTHQWLLPLFFVALAAFVIGKEFSVKENGHKFVVTGEVFLAAALTPGLVILVLYLPLFELIRKLSDTH
jgi:type II secretory pathway component PulF